MRTHVRTLTVIVAILVAALLNAMGVDLAAMGIDLASIVTNPNFELGQSPPRGGPQSYQGARKFLEDVFAGPGTSLYCNCRYDTERKVDPRACGLPPDLSDSERSRRIEWEHVVPASAFGKTFLSWHGHPTCGKKRGRSCARKVSDEFNRMEANLYNLRPAVGSVNNRRSNRVMSQIPGQLSTGRCPLEIAEERVEPAAAIKGDIARIYLYMNQTYPDRKIILPEQMGDYLAWDALDPVSSDECRLARTIAPLQEHVNHVVESRCRRAGL